MERQREEQPPTNNLSEQLDPETLASLAEKVDLNLFIKQMDQLDRPALDRLMGQGSGTEQIKGPPPINGDFFDIADLLSQEEQAIQLKFRSFLETEVRPVINDYWDRGEFPKMLIPKLSKILAETIFSEPYQFPSRSPIMAGIIAMELGRVDPSISTFLGVHRGLCMGSIYMFGSERQKAQWLPPMQRLEKIGSWALTEPRVGSGAAAGLTTTARREGDTWIINGEKKWSGNATFADVNVIWARDLADNQVKGFLVELGTPGYNVQKLHGKIAKRAVDNVLITLEACRVAETNRLPGVESFRDVARQLASGRAGVAWEAVGISMGAYEHALDYTNQRIQFGRPIASFQLIQDKLVQMLGNVTAMQAMVLRLAQLEARDGKISHERASLAKVFCCKKMRETVALAREVLGGNGILLENHVARLFADAEAVYSYEGTNEMNTLIVGRAITGISAFV